MGEYESFHYLVHKQVVHQPNFIKAKEVVPPTFEELWGATAEAGGKKKLLKKDEKLYWRSRHRLEYIFEEERSAKAIVIHVRETDTDTVGCLLHREGSLVVAYLCETPPAIPPKTPRTYSSGWGVSLRRWLLGFAQVWRPIVVDLEVLFPLIDDKRTTKKGTGINDDAKLGRAAVEFLQKRLAVKAHTSNMQFGKGVRGASERLGEGGLWLGSRARRT
jgi:hypothetical protein